MMVDHIDYTNNGNEIMHTENTWGGMKRLSGTQSVANWTVLWSFNYSYNRTGQRSSVTNVHGAYWAYGYDSLGQVVSGPSIGAMAAKKRGQPMAWFLVSVDKMAGGAFCGVMPRKLRVRDEGALSHVMSRGDRREDIFHNDVDRQDFLKTLAEACRKTDWPVHAYCLTPSPLKAIAARVRWGTSKSANARLRPGMQRPALATTRKNTPTYEPKHTMRWVKPFSYQVLPGQ